MIRILNHFVAPAIFAAVGIGAAGVAVYAVVNGVVTAVIIAGALAVALAVAAVGTWRATA